MKAAMAAFPDRTKGSLSQAVHFYQIKRTADGGAPQPNNPSTTLTPTARISRAARLQARIEAAKVELANLEVEERKKAHARAQRVAARKAATQVKKLPTLRVKADALAEKLESLRGTIAKLDPSAVVAVPMPTLSVAPMSTAFDKSIALGDARSASAGPLTRGDHEHLRRRMQFTVAQLSSELKQPARAILVAIIESGQNALRPDKVGRVSVDVADVA